MKRMLLIGMAALLTSISAFAQTGGASATTFSYRLDTYGTGREITPLDSGSLADELQWLAVQTACTCMYNMAQTGDFTQSDPEDYYKPNHIRTYLTGLSGSQTQNTMSYGICFNYAQAAYNDILEYQDYYEDLGMERGGWYIAAAFDNSRQIILFDPVSKDKATMTVNGVSVREYSRQNVRTHGGATKHAWLWVYGNDGTIYWIDPTWTDNSGYVVWGVVRNGEETQMNPAVSLCLINRSGAGYADFNRGNEAKNRGNYDQAIADYDAAIQKDPNNAVAWHWRGYLYEEKKDWDRAIVDLNQAIRLDPNYAKAYLNRGTAYYYKKDNDRAIADYTQAIRLDPNYAMAYYGRGFAYWEKGDNDRAIADYTQVIRLDPNYVFAYNNRGFAYGEKGDNDRAIADYTQAIRLDPNYALAYLNRGNAYWMKGNKTQARADWNKALQLDPNNTMARNNLAKFY
jgi:tetratricopeptide (TPR) repeat protein